MLGGRSYLCYLGKDLNSFVFFFRPSSQYRSSIPQAKHFTVHFSTTLYLQVQSTINIGTNHKRQLTNNQTQSKWNLSTWNEEKTYQVYLLAVVVVWNLKCYNFILAKLTVLKIRTKKTKILNKRKCFLRFLFKTEQCWSLLNVITLKDMEFCERMNSRIGQNFIRSVRKTI